MDVSIFRAFSIEGKAFCIRILSPRRQNIAVLKQLFLFLVSMKSCYELCQKELMILIIKLCLFGGHYLAQRCVTFDLGCSWPPGHTAVYL